MNSPAPWTCPSCRQQVLTSFCARCGECAIVPRDLTVRGLGMKLLHMFTSIDAQALRTTRCLLRRPGALTLAWIEGPRKPYVPPFQFFLIANVVFFAVQSLTGQVVFSSPLASHLQHQDWSALARPLVEQHLASRGTTLALYAPEFDRLVALNAKSLIILMTIPFALLLPIVFLRPARPFMTHVVFAVHLYTFLLLLFCFSLLVADSSRLLGFGGLESPVVDHALTVLNVAVCALYLYAAIGPVYRTSGLVRGVQAVSLAIATVVITVGYRFVLFLVTLSAT